MISPPPHATTRLWVSSWGCFPVSFKDRDRKLILEAIFMLHAVTGASSKANGKIHYEPLQERQVGALGKYVREPKNVFEWT